MLKKISIFWIILAALLLSGALPLGLMSERSVQTVEQGVESEQRLQLLARVDAQALAIDGRFQKFQTATILAATEARNLLLSTTLKLSDAEVAARMSRYRRDGITEIKARDEAEKANPPANPADSIRYNELYPYRHGVLGLDAWYTDVYKSIDNRQSNVFLNNLTEVTPVIAYQIAVTEDLNPLFATITDSKMGTQWVYLTTAEGMMRLYPWAGNVNYPVNWQPTEIKFYARANEKENPDRKAVWTLPYNDFAGAGLMVTNSVPIYDGNRLVAVMSHDLVISDLQKQVLDIKIGTRGRAFLIDPRGNIIAFEGYDPKATPLGQEIQRKLKDVAPGMTNVVDSMIGSKSPGLSSFKDTAGEEWLVVYATIPTTDWHLGLMQPRTEIIQPAIAIRNQIAPIGALLILVGVFVSIILARQIAQPVRKLTHQAEAIEEAVDMEPPQVIAPDALKKIDGTSEITRLATVFSEMVNALQRRRTELESIYAIGQTITSGVEYEATLRALLQAVRQVVDYSAAEIAIVEGDELVVDGWLGHKDWRNTTGRRQKIAHGPMSYVALTKTPLLISAVESVNHVQRLLDHPEYDGKLLIEGGVKSLLGIPLTVGARLIGVLMLVDRKPNTFDETDRRQLIKLAPQASIAIDNALQVRKRESVLKQKIVELQIEIDETKKQKQVSAIVDSDFFKDLQSKADSMRNRARTRHNPDSEVTPNPSSEG